MFQSLARAARALSAPVRIATARYGEVDPTAQGGGAGSGFSVSGGIPDVDYLDELAFPHYLEEFKRLANDPQIAKELRANTAPLIAADWQMEPATEDARDLLISEFVAANLFQQEGDTFGADFWCRTPWEDHLRDALRILANGFAVFQVVDRMQGRFRVCDVMKYLQPESIIRWYFAPDDALIKIERQYMGADGAPVTGEFIDAADLFIYTWDKEGSNLLGRPLIRPMWGSFQCKMRYRKLAVIGTMKTAVAIPVFTNPAGASDREIARGEALVKVARSGNVERLYASLTEGQKITFAEATGEGTKGIPELVSMENREISKVGGNPSNDLGSEGQGGSRGLAGTQSSFAMLLLAEIAQCIVKYQRMRVRRYVDANFPGVVRHPKPKCSNIDPFEKTSILPEVVKAIQAKALTNTIDTENEIRRRWKFMEIDDAERAAAQATEPASGAPSPATNAPGAPGGQAGPENKGQEPGTQGTPSPVTQERIRLESLPTFQAARVDAAAIVLELQKRESLYLATLRHVQADMREAVVEQIRAGRLRPAKVADVRVPFQDELRDRLLALLKDVRDYGREQVLHEIRRQILHIHAARLVQSNPATRRGALAYSNQQAQVTADLDVSNLVSRLQGQTLAKYHDLAGAGASPDEIAAGLDDYLGSITDKQVDQMARSSTSVAFNGGRAVSILEHADQLEETAVRIEAADDDSCDPCATPANLGGLNFLEVVIGTPEWLAAQPPNGCDGGDRCRGLMVVRVKATRAAA